MRWPRMQQCAILADMPLLCSQCAADVATHAPSAPTATSLRPVVKQGFGSTRVCILEATAPPMTSPRSLCISCVSGIACISKQLQDSLSTHHQHHMPESLMFLSRWGSCTPTTQSWPSAQEALAWATCSVASCTASTGASAACTAIRYALAWPCCTRDAPDRAHLDGQRQCRAAQPALCRLNDGACCSSSSFMGSAWNQRPAYHKYSSLPWHHCAALQQKPCAAWPHGHCLNFALRLLPSSPGETLLRAAHRRPRAVRVQIIKLSGAVQKLPREVVENVHGVAPRFLELPPGMRNKAHHPHIFCMLRQAPLQAGQDWGRLACPCCCNSWSVKP